MIGLSEPFPYATSRALVTGASSGIGAVFADRLAAKGCSLVLVARSIDTLDAMAEQLRHRHGVEVTTLRCDLARPEERAVLLDGLAAIEIDLLVNNAGQGSHGRLVDLDPARELALVELNCAAVVDLTRALLPSMVARGRGGIVNVASTAAFQSTPTMATYGATKAFVLSFSGAIAQECRRNGVRVLAFCPGAVATNFGNAAGDRHFAQRYFDRAPGPEAVVPAALDALDHARLVVVPGAMNRISSFAARYAPRRIVGVVAEQVLRTDRGPRRTR